MRAISVLSGEDMGVKASVYASGSSMGGAYVVHL